MFLLNIPNRCTDKDRISAIAVNFLSFYKTRITTNLLILGTSFFSIVFIEYRSGHYSLAEYYYLVVIPLLPCPTFHDSSMHFGDSRKTNLI